MKVPEMTDRFRRSDFVKTPEQIDDYIEGFIKRIKARYPTPDVEKHMRGYLSQAEASRWMENNSVQISTFMIAYFVNRDSKVTLDKIARYCVDANMNPEKYLHRAINEHVDNVYKITELKTAIADMKAELERERQKLLPLWKRVLGMFKRRKGREDR